MNSFTFQPLLAADILETVIGALFFILWIAAQLLGGRKEAKNNKQPRPRPQQVGMDDGLPQLRNQGPPNQGQPNQEETLRNEVEDFLSRAQGKPARPEPGQRPQPGLRPEPARLQNRPQPQRERLVEPVARQLPVSGQPSHNLRDEGVAEHVARHISTQEIAAHTKSLGAEVATADDQLELRLHEKFDHEVGRLKHRDTPAREKRQNADLAAEVAAMLRSPEGMRQLIVANEILRRPEW